MRKYLIFLLFLIVFPCRLFAQDVLDRIVAVVDNDIILLSEWSQYTYSLALQLGIDPQKEPDKIDKLQKQTLNDLIIQKVLLVKAREDSIEVNEKQVDNVLEEQINQMIAQLGSQEKLEQYFNKSIRQIKREFRDEVKDQLMVRTLRDKKFQEIQINRREVEEFYKTYRDSLPEIKESVKISHILMKVQPSQEAVEKARKKAEEILQRLKNGEDFAELAKKYSDDPGSASKGGYLGPMKRGDLVKEFEEVAFLLEPGEISDIVRTQFGFHIIKLDKKRGEKIYPRHILIKLEATPDDEKATVEKLKKIREKILSGEITFEEAAKKYSQDKTTADKGGDLGWFQVDQFQVEEFKNTIKHLKVGEISQPVKTKFGYHLIRLDEHQPRRKLDINKDWEQIEMWALNLKRQREFQKWIEEIKKDVYIDVKL